MTRSDTNREFVAADAEVYDKWQALASAHELITAAAPILRPHCSHTSALRRLSFMFVTPKTERLAEAGRVHWGRCSVCATTRESNTCESEANQDERCGFGNSGSNKSGGPGRYRSNEGIILHKKLLR